MEADKLATLRAYVAKKQAGSSGVNKTHAARPTVSAENQLLGSLSQQKPVKQPIKRSENTTYDELNAIGVGKTASAVWKDSMLDSINCYDVKQINAANIIMLGKELIRHMNGGDINSITADICLVLAVSIPKPASTVFEHMLEALPPNIGKKLTFNQPTPGPKELSKLQRTRLEKFRELLGLETEEEKRKALQDQIDALEAQERGEGVSTNTNDTRDTDAASYCFLAAILLKLYSKSAESMINSLATIKGRFSAWYDGAPTALDAITFSDANLSTLRLVFARRPELMATWTLWAAYNENRTQNPLLQTHQGLLNYLACQLFSYMGMHAYSLIIDIHEKTGVKFGQLLKELDCPHTRASVRTVFEVIRDHEVTTAHPNRKTYFRYARSWDPKFFGSLQSSNCKTLVYVVASVNKKLAAQGSAGDPLEIYAIKDLDPLLVTRLEEVAVRLSNKILDQMLQDEMTGSSWFTE
ncbi:TPA_asm: N [Garlic alphacytorhabdovirus 1]|nr:TPA_asm: N [Garlic alphacytorhabdovirus 1]